MQEIIRFLCVIGVHASMIMMTFSLFKIPLKENHKQITILAVLVGGSNYLVRFQMGSLLFLPAALIVYIISLMIIRGYPIAYSSLVSLSGYLIGSFLDELVTYQIMINRSLSLNDLLNSNYYYVMSNAAAAALCLGVASIFRWKNWGTSFIVSRFHGKYALRRSNYVWALILVSGFLTVQYGISSSLKMYNLIALGLFCVFAILYTYRENKKILKIRFPNRQKRKASTSNDMDK